MVDLIFEDSVGCKKLAERESVLTAEVGVLGRGDRLVERSEFSEEVELTRERDEAVEEEYRSDGEREEVGLFASLRSDANTCCTLANWRAACADDGR